MLMDIQKQVLKRQKAGQKIVPVHPGNSGTAFLKSLIHQPQSDSQLAEVISGRYELKYYIDESKAEAVKQFIKPYLHIDRYGKDKPGNSYPIASLYFDSPTLEFCRQNMQGHKNRFKLRIRSYNDDPGYPCYVEIKRRINSIVVKTRAPVLRQDLKNLIENSYIPHEKFSTDEKTLGQFLFYAKNMNARPLISIWYIRQAFEDDSENRVRITFDRKLSYRANQALDTGIEGKDWRMHFSNKVVLEIKFTGRYPAWINAMVKTLNLCCQSFSKYVISVEKCCSLGFCAPSVWG
ncbi:MAG: polyphosphate polymerase domain-containing protein [Candidatus Brocadiia bacterium]|nr:MAG: polyphosphate polymerase domain-containing protein [Candidatus Brocadiia bacterium]